MSVEAIQRGVERETFVQHVFRVRCDDTPSGFIEVSKTAPTGANAMTVTIKPLYGEAFTVNADLLQDAVAQALHSRARETAGSWYREESWRRAQAERDQPCCAPTEEAR